MINPPDPLLLSSHLVAPDLQVRVGFTHWTEKHALMVTVWLSAVFNSSLSSSSRNEWQTWRAALRPEVDVAAGGEADSRAPHRLEVPLHGLSPVLQPAGPIRALPPSLPAISWFSNHKQHLHIDFCEMKWNEASLGLCTEPGHECIWGNGSRVSSRVVRKSSFHQTIKLELPLEDPRRLFHTYFSVCTLNSLAAGSIITENNWRIIKIVVQWCYQSKTNCLLMFKYKLFYFFYLNQIRAQKINWLVKIICSNFDNWLIIWVIF